MPLTENIIGKREYKVYTMNGGGLTEHATRSIYAEDFDDAIHMFRHTPNAYLKSDNIPLVIIVETDMVVESYNGDTMISNYESCKGRRQIRILNKGVSY